MSGWRMILRLTLALAAVSTAALGPPLPAAAQEVAHDAESAWVAGDHARAETLYARRLAADSSDAIALHRMALLLAWNERYDRSLELFDRLLRIAPDNREAAVDRARVLAWKGHPNAALSAVDALLARDPGDEPALRARALFASWAGEYEASLAAYDRLLGEHPADRDLLYQRARVLSWASRLEESAGAWRSLLESEPNDPEALLGLARVLSWSGDQDSAAVLYGRVLASAPDNLEARRGLARAASWGGELRAGERLWREILADAPEDVPSLVGLAQTLRWQGRQREAMAYLRRARGLDPEDADVRTQIRWTAASLSHAIGPVFSYERDSDDNMIATTSLGLSWRLGKRLELRTHGAYAAVEELAGFDPRKRQAWRAEGRLAVDLGSGWAASAGGGAAGSDGPGTGMVALYGASLHTPGFLPVSASASFNRTPLFATAQAVDAEVVVEEWALSASARPSPGWGVDGGVTLADFQGFTSNRRLLGRGGVYWNPARTVMLRLGATALGFENQVREGYFSPDFYGLLELSGRWQRDFGRWFTLAEAAPGLQQIGEEGDASGALRLLGRLGYTFSPGRHLGVSATYSTLGLQRLSVTDSDYRYWAVVLSGGLTY